MPQSFRSYLRECRMASRTPMADVASAIEVSIPYYSDVEHGRRKPFPVKREKYAALARVISADLELLMDLALKERNDLQFEPETEDQFKEMAAVLMRRAELGSLPAADFREILEILNRSKK